MEDFSISFKLAKVQIIDGYSHLRTKVKTPATGQSFEL
jgi:hypothetical protein